MSETLETVQLNDNFYRDGLKKVIFLILSILLALFLLMLFAVYQYFAKPSPKVFTVDPEWRVLQSVPLDQPYLSTPAMLQWVTDALRKSFVYDFLNYNIRLKQASQYFTSDGWQTFLNHLNIYANYNNVESNKLFITAAPLSAPIILNSGLLSGRYAWQVQIPMEIQYAGYNPPPPRKLVLQVWVVRVPTLNNLMGVAIDSVVVDVQETFNP